MHLTAFEDEDMTGCRKLYCSNIINNNLFAYLSVLDIGHFNGLQQDLSGSNQQFIIFFDDTDSESWFKKKKKKKKKI